MEDFNVPDSEDKTQQDPSLDPRVPCAREVQCLSRQGFQPTAPGRHSLAKMAAFRLRLTDSDDHAGVRHSGPIVASPELCVLAPVFKRHETYSPPDVGEHVGDLRVEESVSLAHSPSASQSDFPDDGPCHVLISR